MSDDAPIVLTKSTPQKSADKFRTLTRPTLICYQEDFLAWDGAAYQLVEAETIDAEVAEFLKHAKLARYEEIPDTGEKRTTYVSFNPKRGDINEVVTALKHLCHRPSGTMTPPCWLSRPQWDVVPDPRNVISCKNGLLDITTRKLYPQTADFFTRSALPIDYVAHARDCVRWKQFIREVTGGKNGLSILLQQMFGYLISTDTSQQRIFFLLGPPAGGKGTVLRMIEALCGSINVHTPTIASLGSTLELEAMIAKSVILVTDLNCADKMKMSAATTVLNMMSGEDTLGIGRKYKKALSLRLPGRAVLAGNSLPNFGDQVAAIARRLLLMPFKVSFQGREDYGLEAKLRAELGGILNWALDGLDALKAAGRFIEPAESVEVKSRMLYLSDPVRGFVAECCTVEAGAAVSKSGLHAAYAAYVVKWGLKPAALARFAENLYEIAGSIGETRPRAGDGSRVQTFTGIRLRDGIAADDDAPVAGVLDDFADDVDEYGLPN